MSVRSIRDLGSLNEVKPRTGQAISYRLEHSTPGSTDTVSSNMLLLIKSSLYY